MLRRFSLASALLVAGSIVASVAPAIAATASADLDVSGTVVANCTISTTAIAFAGYDPVTANKTSPLDVTGAVKTTCTKDAPVSITLNDGLNYDSGTRRLKTTVAGSDAFLSYSLYQDSGYSTAWGSTTSTDLDLTGTGLEVNSTVYGRSPGGQNASVANNYSDTVIATVNF
ncbi:spore coat U domain-containing protein [Trichormus sp. NMC-1]|uniref:Csu type fimbrial protein n=1 Tax=Trichormus sp. NMC-1 TaxID=1853259 RepID=UPI0008DBEB2E|nr:spore coat U domain-containing protein [Trichormus sp. NMC-1]